MVKLRVYTDEDKNEEKEKGDKMTIDLSETDSARLAAYFDTLGSVSVCKSTDKIVNGKAWYSLQVTIASSGERKQVILHWIASTFDVNITNKRSTRVCIVNLSGKNRKKRKYESFTTTIHLSSKKAYDFLHVIYPYTLLHKEEADIAFVFYTHYVLRNRKVATSDERNIAEECYQKLRATHLKNRLLKKSDNGMLMGGKNN